MKLLYVNRIKYYITSLKRTNGTVNIEMLISFFVVVHLFTCAYIVWVISPPCLSPPTLPPFLSSVSGRSRFALVTDFVEEKT
jgi:hypothetical protein